MKRILNLTACLAAAGTLGLMLSSCSTISDTFKPAELVQVGFEPLPVQGTEYQGTISLKIRNPNTYAIQAKEVQYKLEINSDTVTEGSFDKGVDIRPGAEETVVGKIRFKYTSDRPAAAGKLLVEPYALSGSASVGLHMLHFRHTGEFTSAKQ